MDLESIMKELNLVMKDNTYEKYEKQIHQHYQDGIF